MVDYLNWSIDRSFCGRWKWVDYDVVDDDDDDDDDDEKNVDDKRWSTFKRYI